MRALEVLWKRAGMQGNNEGEQSSLSMTHPSKDRRFLGPPQSCIITQKSPFKTRKSEGWFGFMWTRA